MYSLQVVISLLLIAKVFGFLVSQENRNNNTQIKKNNVEVFNSNMSKSIFMEDSPILNVLNEVLSKGSNTSWLPKFGKVLYRFNITLPIYVYKINQTQKEQLLKRDSSPFPVGLNGLPDLGNDFYNISYTFPITLFELNRTQSEQISDSDLPTSTKNEITKEKSLLSENSTETLSLNLGHENTLQGNKNNKIDKWKINSNSNKNGDYAFSTSQKDGISDLLNERTEVRKGDKVTGSYAYKDGFFYRKVNYAADKNGFRIISDSTVPLPGNGPKVNPNGKAEIETNVGGYPFRYIIHGKDLKS